MIFRERTSSGTFLLEGYHLLVPQVRRRASFVFAILLSNNPVVIGVLIPSLWCAFTIICMMYLIFPFWSLIQSPLCTVFLVCSFWEPSFYSFPCFKPFHVFYFHFLLVLNPCLLSILCSIIFLSKRVCSDTRFQSARVCWFFD